MQRHNYHFQFAQHNNLQYYHPATNALWFYAPRTGESCVNLWFNQRNAGRYQNHCFYIPNQGVCRQLH